MKMKDFITKEFPALKMADTAAHALSVMAGLKVRHLPVVSGGIYRGLLSEESLPAVPESSLAVGGLVLSVPGMLEPGHLHEVIARMVRDGLTVLPVISDGGEYRGAVTREMAFDAMACLCHAEAAGSVVALELPPRGYALSDIARIIEANNAHVLSLLSDTDRLTGRIVLTVKTDLEDATPLIRTFERFNYTVLYALTERGRMDEELQRRIDELSYYINM
jgi:CBS domain-containing protein